MNKPRKVVVIGIDCALPGLVERHIAEGYLPTFKKLIEGGVIADNCMAVYPTITPPNWATIATGAWPGTHGQTCFWAPHKPGQSSCVQNTVASYNSERWQAEPIWDALDKAGKRCIVLNYPGSWPSRMANGIMVGGAGLSPGEHRDGYYGNGHDISLCGNFFITNGYFPKAARGSLVSAEGWENLSEPGEDPLEMAANLPFPDAAEDPADTTWCVLVRQSGSGGYDRVTLSPTKDFNDAFCTLSVGEWSHKIVTRITMSDGSQREVFFRCKLIQLSADAEDFCLFVTALIDLSKWVSPPEVLSQLAATDSVPVPHIGMVEYMQGLIDVETFVECAEIHSQWLADAAKALLSKNQWDLFIMHSHPPDWAYHALMTDMDPSSCTDEKKREAAWEAHRRVYQAQDSMIAQITQAAGNDTLIVLVSDHGAVPDGPMINVNDILVSAGLTVLLEKPPAGPGDNFYERATREHGFLNKPDIARSKALPQRTCHIYVNLKGRDEGGIVEPEDYEKVQQEIIDALLTYRDPQTGMRPISMALSKQDAMMIGLYGDNVGDVVYAIYPWFSDQHGKSLPAAKWGIGSLKTLFVMNGPGIKKGVRLQRPMHLTDVVPTICHLMDWPVPQHVEGAVIYQAFRDPNFKRVEIAKLTEGLARMEAALSRRSKEPWDKHDCA